MLFRRRWPAAKFRFRDVGCWIFTPDPLSAMHIGDKGFAGVVERSQDGGLLGIVGTDAHPGEPRRASASLTHNSECVFTFGRQCAYIFRDTGLIALPRIIDPAFGEVKAQVDRGVWSLPSVRTPNTAT